MDQATGRKTARSRVLGLARGQPVQLLTRLLQRAPRAVSLRARNGQVRRIRACLRLKPTGLYNLFDGRLQLTQTFHIAANA